MPPKYLRVLESGWHTLLQPLPPCLHDLDYAAFIMWQSFNSERAGAHINRVRTPERAGLNQTSLSSLVFGTFSNAPVSKTDTPCLVSKFRADGNLLERPINPAKKTSQRP